MVAPARSSADGVPAQMRRKIFRRAAVAAAQYPLDIVFPRTLGVIMEEAGATR